MAARAMKVSGELTEPGLSVIVDVGASKTEVSLIHNDDDGVREVRTGGSDKIGGNEVRDAVVERVLPIVKKKATFVSPALRAKLAAQAEVAIATDGHINIPNLGNGNSFDMVVTEKDISECSRQVAEGVQELVREVVQSAEIHEVRCVRCIGGGTKLPVVKEAVQSAFPAAEVRQFDPDELISCGATLDGADRTNRLPLELKTKVVTVAPYSIGISLVGEVISFVIQRGQSLPAFGETVQVTTVDNQADMNFHIFQGEHVLSELSNEIGVTVLDHLPQRPRGTCKAVCRIEYNEDGILQFSARETLTGKTVRAQFTTKAEFTDSDRARLTVAQPRDAIEEMKIAETRYFRGRFLMDIERAEQQRGTVDFTAALTKWRKWIDANETGPAALFSEKRFEALSDFWRLNRALWNEPDQILADMKFCEIWPRAPVMVKCGSAIVRFLVSSEFSNVSADVINMETQEKTDDLDVCQFVEGGRIESVLRVYFPGNGTYKVQAFAGPPGKPLSSVRMSSIGRDYWLFDVSGCPARRRPLCQVITGRRFTPLICPDTLKVNPGSSCVHISGPQYQFSCDFKGAQLLINGREPKGAQEQTFFAKVTNGPAKGDWLHQDCVMEFPSNGVWRLLFWVDGTFATIQTIVAGPMLEPTFDETIALAAALAK
jgi:hypothetical protein